MATVIILNGVSSVGKTTLAEAIQKTARADFLHLSMDGFIAMLPDGREFAPNWFPVEHLQSNEGRLVRIHNGPLGKRLLLQMRAFAAELADGGFNVIVDEVCEAAEIESYRELLVGHKMHVVKVTANLAEVERRERERGDRLIGLAREQDGRIHTDIEYDQVVDTSVRSSDECATDILSAIV
jgi:chloramphenicol 3-O phosphotransferase